MDKQSPEAVVASCTRGATLLAEQIGRVGAANDRLANIVVGLEALVSSSVAAFESDSKAAEKNDGKGQSNIREVDVLYNEYMSKMENTMGHFSVQRDKFIKFANSIENSVQAIESIQKSIDHGGDISSLLETLKTSVSELERDTSNLSEPASGTAPAKTSYDDKIDQVNRLMQATEAAPEGISEKKTDAKAASVVGEDEDEALDEDEDCQNHSKLPPQFMNAKHILDGCLIYLNRSGINIAMRLLNDMIGVLQQQLFMQNVQSEEEAVLFQIVIDEVLKRLEPSKNYGVMRLAYDPLELGDTTIEWLARHKLLKPLIIIHKRLSR